MLGYLGNLHNYHSNHHTYKVHAAVHSLAGCLQRKVAGVALQELAGKLLDVLVLEVLEDMHQQEEEALPL